MSAVTFTPNPTSPHPNAASLPLTGDFLPWDGLDLTNYMVNMFGTGTLEFTGPSSLVNSTLELQGPNGNLLNESLMVLQNSQLELAGDSLSGRGMVLATNSTISVTSSTPSKDTYGTPLTKQETSDLASAQPQLISLKSSTLNIEGNNYTGPVVMDGKSTVNIDGPLNVGAKNLGIYATGPQLGTVNFNADAAPNITGVMQIDANLNINCKQPVTIDGGRLILAGSPDGGTIAITSGTLEFAQTPGFLQSPETGSDGVQNTRLAFTGKTGSVQFDGTSQIGPLIIGIMPNMSEVAVFNAGHILANIQLAPGPSAYSASEFSVHGNTLLFPPLIRKFRMTMTSKNGRLLRRAMENYLL